MARVAITGLMLNNVRDFGAKGDGVTDDRVAIQAAVDNAVAAGMGGIFFPEGTFIVSRNGAFSASIRLLDVTNFRIAGTGPKSVVKFISGAAGGLTWSMFLLTGACAKIYFDNLTLDGNRTGVTGSSVETRLVRMATTISDIDFDRVIFTSSPHYGATLAGTRIAVRNCRFTDHANGFGEAPIDINDVVEACLIQGCFFYGNTGIDIQAVPDVIVTNALDITIDDCFLDKGGTAATLYMSGLGLSTGARRLRVTNCVILGTILVSRTPEVDFQDNFIEASQGGGVPPLQLEGISKRSLISGNSISATGAGNTAIFIGVVAGTFVDNLRFTDNLIACSTGGVAMDIAGGDNITIADNEFLAFAGGTSNQAIQVHTVTHVTNIQVRDNDILGAWTGVPIFMEPDTGTIADIFITDNRIQGSAAAAVSLVTINGGTFTKTPTIMGNRCDQDALIALAQFAFLPTPCAIIGGGGGRGTGGIDQAATQYMGTGNPEGVIFGARGDTFARLDGGIDSTYYVKKTGDLTTTGWVEVGPVRFSPPEQWVQNNVAASQTAVALSTQVSTNFPIDIQMIRAGSIVGLNARFTEAITAGTVTLIVSINGVAGTLNVALVGAGTSGRSTQAAGIDTFVAGDLIGIQITTTVGFLPITTDVEAWLEIEEAA